METGELWVFISLLSIALSAGISFVVCAIYIPIKKFPSAVKSVVAFWYQNFYLVLVFSLFATIMGLGVYIPISYESLRLQNMQEIVRSVLFAVFTVSLFFVTLAFKKQTLSTGKIIVHSFFASMVLIVATQENTLDFFTYPYILIILALFAIVRYGVGTFSKKL